MQARGRHQGDEAAHRIEAHTPEVPVPVDFSQLLDGLRVGAQDVD